MPLVHQYDCRYTLFSEAKKRVLYNSLLLNQSITSSLNASNLKTATLAYAKNSLDNTLLLKTMQAIHEKPCSSLINTQIKNLQSAIDDDAQLMNLRLNSQLKRNRITQILGLSLLFSLKAMAELNTATLFFSTTALIWTFNFLSLNRHIDSIGNVDLKDSPELYELTHWELEQYQSKSGNQFAVPEHFTQEHLDQINGYNEQQLNTHRFV